MKPELLNLSWILTLSLLLIAGWSCLWPSVFNDERIYILSAAYLDNGIITNPEHPQLIKFIYAGLLPAEVKSELRKHFPPTYESVYNVNKPTNWYANNPIDEYLFQVCRFLRILTGFILGLACYAYFGKTPKGILAFNLLLLTNTLFVVMLDGWLILCALIAFDMTLTKKNPYLAAILAFIVAPLIKANGILVGLTVLLLDRRNTGIKLIVLGLSLLVAYTAAGVSSSSGLFTKEMARGVIHYIYAIPFYGMAALYLIHQKEAIK